MYSQISSLLFDFSILRPTLARVLLHEAQSYSAAYGSKCSDILTVSMTIGLVLRSGLFNAANDWCVGLDKQWSWRPHGRPRMEHSDMRCHFAHIFSDWTQIHWVFRFAGYSHRSSCIPWYISDSSCGSLRMGICLWSFQRGKFPVFS